MHRRRRKSSRPRFQRPAQIAETATSGVAAHMDAGDILTAVPLQNVAAAAWGAAADPAALPELHLAVREALADLDDVAGAGRARDFLLMVDRHLHEAVAEPADTHEQPLSLFGAPQATDPQDTEAP